MFARFHNLLPRHLNREIAEIYATVAIKKFAFQMVTIFQAIYLYRHFEESLPKVLLFYAATSILFGLLAPLGAKIMSRIGLKKSITASFPFAFLFYIFLLNIEKVAYFYILAIIVSAFYKTLFWPAFHIEFTKFSKDQERGREFSTYRALISVASAVAPFAGGFIISYWGFPFVFGAVLALLSVAAFPLLLSPDVHQHYTDTYEKAFLRYLHPKNWKQILAFVSKGSEAAIQIVIWPIFIYNLAIDYSSLGAITTGSMVVSLFAGLVLGRFLDTKKTKRKILRISTIFLSIAHFTKIFVYNAWSALGVDVFHKLAGNTGTHITYQTILYDEASKKGEQSDEFIIYREIGHNIGRGLVLCLLALIFTFSSNFYIAFILAAFLSLLLPFI